LAKKNKLIGKKELLVEKNLSKRNKAHPDFEVGYAFVEEATGSATMINLDGRRDFDHQIKKAALRADWNPESGIQNPE